MLRLEDFMEIQKLYHDGVSITEIARRLAKARKTVRKYLPGAPRPYSCSRKNGRLTAGVPICGSAGSKGVHNASRLFPEIQERGYDGGYTQVSAWCAVGGAKAESGRLCVLRPSRGSRRRWTGDILATGRDRGCMPSR